jgi:hypothetical protein
MRGYKAIVWVTNPNKPGQRVSLWAESLEEASKQIDDKFGEGAVITFWNEEDAAKPR